MKYVSIKDIMSPPPTLKIFDKNRSLKWPGNHVFLIKVGDYFDGIKDNYRDILSISECKKADNFFRSEDRESYVVRKHFLRSVLSILLTKKAQDIQFNVLANKKPAVDHIPFNVSHSANLVAIALSGKPVGIDVEFIKHNFSYQIMLDDCFNTAEQITIEKSAHTTTSFYTLWTRKEALLKVSGVGLNDVNLKELVVLLPVCKYIDQSYRISSSVVFEEYMMSIAWSTEVEKIEYWILSN